LPGLDLTIPLLAPAVERLDLVAGQDPAQAVFEAAQLLVEGLA
jgi:hypothetical protein